VRGELDPVLGIALFLAVALGVGMAKFRFYRGRWYQTAPGDITFGEAISAPWSVGQGKPAGGEAVASPASPFDL